MKTDAEKIAPKYSYFDMALAYAEGARSGVTNLAMGYTPPPAQIKLDFDNWIKDYREQNEIQ